MMPFWSFHDSCRLTLPLGLKQAGNRNLQTQLLLEIKGWKAWVEREPFAGQPAFLVDLSPTLNFVSLLPVLPPPASPCCPLPGTFVFTWPTSQGTRSYLWLLGLAADYAAPVRLFHSNFSPAPKLNCSVISCHPPSTTSHIPYHIPNNVRFHCRIQRYERLWPASFSLQTHRISGEIEF